MISAEPISPLITMSPILRRAYLMGGARKVEWAVEVPGVGEARERRQARKEVVKETVEKKNIWSDSPINCVLTVRLKRKNGKGGP